MRLKRLAAGQPIVPSVDVPGKSFASAADAAFGAISDFWKNKSAIDFGCGKIKFTAEAKFNTLSEWASLQSRLGTVQTVVGIDMIAFNMNEARIDIAYVGSFDQLRGTLLDAGIGTDLARWRVVARARRRARPMMLLRQTPNALTVLRLASAPVCHGVAVARS